MASVEDYKAKLFYEAKFLGIFLIVESSLGIFWNSDQFLKNDNTFRLENWDSTIFLSI